MKSGLAVLAFGAAAGWWLYGWPVALGLCVYCLVAFFMGQEVAEADERRRRQMNRRCEENEWPA